MSLLWRQKYRAQNDSFSDQGHRFVVRNAKTTSGRQALAAHIEEVARAREARGAELARRWTEYSRTQASVWRTSSAVRKGWSVDDNQRARRQFGLADDLRGSRYTILTRAAGPTGHLHGITELVKDVDSRG